MDLLWSDPTESEDEMGIVPHSEREPAYSIVKYGPDRIEKFLQTNHHQLILRSHGLVQNGFSKFADGQLITINSCTNYCNSYNNDACFFVIQKQFEITPKVIQPLAQSNQYWDEDQKRPPSPSTP